MENDINNSPFQFITEEEKVVSIVEENNEVPISNEIKIDNKTTEDFVTGLPDWDLAPPYEVVRRVIRK